MATSPKIPLNGLVTALSHKTRWLILAELLKEDGLPSGEMAKRIGEPAANTSKHMNYLHKVGLVTRGYGRVYRIPPQFRVEGEPMSVDFGVVVMRLDQLEKK